MRRTAKVYHIIKQRTDLEAIINKIKIHQKTNSKLIKLKHRLENNDHKILPYYCLHENVLFIKGKNEHDPWKVFVPKTVEKELIIDYHVRYGHMGPRKVSKALAEHMYIKDLNRSVRKYIKTCHVCQLVKCNNERKEGTMIPITSTQKLERVFLDICGPFPRSGGRHRYKFIIIIFDHFSKYTKLYPVSRATTTKVLDIVINHYLPELGTPKTIITDHGTQFKGIRWKETLLQHGIRTYKTSVYHPNSNPSERVLREVGRILRTYCFDQQGRWSDYLPSTELFLNLAYHQTIETTPYEVMHERQPPREVTALINFPETPEYKFDKIKFYNKLVEKANKQKEKYQNLQSKVNNYSEGERVLLRNKQLPSTIEGIAKKLLLLYTGPYVITKDKRNNTYELMDPTNQQIKGTYNQVLLKRYYEDPITNE